MPSGGEMDFTHGFVDEGMQKIEMQAEVYGCILGNGLI
jgi:hypothetical protein